MSAATTKTQIVTLCDLIIARGVETGQRTALHFADESFSYDQLCQGALRMACFLAGKGVRKGDRVVLLVPNSSEFFHAFYGTLLLGAVAVPLFPETAPDRNIQIARFCEAKCIVMPSSASSSDLGAFMLKANDLPVYTVDEAQCMEMLEQLPEVGADDLAFLQFTSGSTGDPKGVMLTHGNLVQNCEQMIEGMQISEQDIFCSWLPIYHDMGLILMTIAPFLVGAELVLLPTSLSNVRVWLKAIQVHRATFTAAPDFAYRLCLRYVRKPEEFDITSLRVALNAAEPVRSQTIRDFESAYRLNNVLQAGYGLAESSVGVSMDEPGSPMKVDERGLVCVGKPFPRAEVRILDDEGNQLPTGEVGRIAVKSPSNCKGYYNNPEATQAIFLADGFFDTGDMGYVDADGGIYIAGRRKNIIITGGKTIANQEIEETVDRHEAVRASAAVGIDRGHIEGEQAFVFAEIRRGPSLSEDERENIALEIVALLHQRLGFRPGRVYLVRNHTIPKTYNGKVQHLKLKQAFLSESLREDGRILFPDY